jgi:peptidoglycan/LPS O-acetylase OafA/YrhL
MSSGRLPQLDVLRAIAILLVLCHHMMGLPDNYFFAPLRALQKAGWAGVDLFFVLSGFLVSGLVIKEYQKYKSFDAWRFFVRRGFKIYPAYYVFLLLSLPTIAWIPGQVTPERFLVECCFIQNHYVNIWGHTWSLAIEEQFYVLLCLGFFILSRRAKDPLKILFCACVFCMIAPLIVRWQLFLYIGPERVHAFLVKPLITGTVVRIDGLAFGVLLSLIYHTHELKVETLVKKFRWWLLTLAILLLMPCAVGGYESFFNYVFGLTLLYLGCGAFLLLALFCMPPSKRGVLGLLSGIGFYSYSIYLWHKPLTAIFPLPWFSFIPMGCKVPLFILASIGLGILMSRLVEVPALKVRDKLYPSRSSSI